MTPARHKTVQIIGGLLALGFVIGIVFLLQFRFATGDIYPGYSTLRADPFGAKAWYEGLDELPQLTVSRNFHPPHRDLFRPEHPELSTVFILGSQLREFRNFPTDGFEPLDEFIRNGGRLVFSFEGMIRQSWWFFPESDSMAGEEDDSEDFEEAEEDEPVDLKDDFEDIDEGELAIVNLGDQWGAVVKFEEEIDLDILDPATGVRSLKTSWYSKLCFTDLAVDWDVIHEISGYPVIIEKKIGQGSVVLMADSYVFSNEAIWRDRQPQLLARLIGANRQSVTFDEFHLGVRARPSIAGLIRGYGLHILVFSLILLALLFIWKNSSSLVPPLDEADGSLSAARGKGMEAGFINLLQRHVPEKALLPTCYQEWKKSSAAKAHPEATLKMVESIVHGSQARKDPVEMYRVIQEHLHSQRFVKPK